jgi:hypothetical protein
MFHESVDIANKSNERFEKFTKYELGNLFLGSKFLISKECVLTNQKRPLMVLAYSFCARNCLKTQGSQHF